VSEFVALVYGAAAFLLVVGGALKLVDPSGSVGALRALGVPVEAGRVRLVAAAEVGLGALALALSVPVVAVAVAVSYAAFFGVTAVALARRLPIDSCGCLGRLETPPGVRHLVVLAAGALAAFAEVVAPSPAALERLGEGGGAGVLFGLGVALCTGAAVVAFVTGRRPSTPR